MNPVLSRPIFRTVAALSCALAALGAAPARADVQDSQQWTLITVQKELSDRWRAYFEVQPRLAAHPSGVERLLVRPAIGYRLTPKLSVWQGYGWTPLFIPRFADEHRVFQQLLYEDTLGATSLASRTRLEERFIQGAGGTAVRLRSMLRLSHPISRDKKWALVGYDELFFNLNSTDAGPVSGFDQNRLFAGVSRQLNRHLRLETGYMLTLVNVPRTTVNRHLDIWVVQAALNL